MGIIELMDKDFPRDRAFDIQPTGDEHGFDRFRGTCHSFSHLETAVRRYSSGRRRERTYHIIGSQQAGYQLAVPIGETHDGKKQYLHLAKLVLIEN